MLDQDRRLLVPLLLQVHVLLLPPQLPVDPRLPALALALLCPLLKRDSWQYQAPPLCAGQNPPSDSSILYHCASALFSAHVHAQEHIEAPVHVRAQPLVRQDACGIQKDHLTPDKRPPLKRKKRRYRPFSHIHSVKGDDGYKYDEDAVVQDASVASDGTYPDRA